MRNSNEWIKHKIVLFILPCHSVFDNKYRGFADLEFRDEELREIEDDVPLYDDFLAPGCGVAYGGP